VWSGLAALLVFPVLHFSYGLGYAKGIVDFVLLRRREAGRDIRLSR
jgi:hypothetical protein